MPTNPTPAGTRVRRRERGGSAPWLIAIGALACALALPAIFALLLWGSAQGLWPARLSLLETAHEGAVLGEVVQAPSHGATAWLVRTAVLGGHGRYRRFLPGEVRRISQPQHALRLHYANGDQHYTLDSAPAGVPLALEFANAAGPLERSLESLRRLWHLVVDDPIAGNAAGGLWPALVGTVVLVFLMTLLVTPLGVLAALYLHEYAPPGRGTRLLRAAVNHLAGMPSIVIGMFGLGFFVQTVGGGIDAWLYAEALPQPTFGAGGLLWAALTLAILTLPVVIVATEEGLARVPPGCVWAVSRWAPHARKPCGIRCCRWRGRHC